MTPDPHEPHEFEPWEYPTAGDGCRWCGLPAVAGLHLRWNAQRSVDDDPSPT